MKKNILDQLCTLSPCEIIYNPNSDSRGGFYPSSYFFENSPTPAHIIINSKIKLNYQKFAVLAHEIAHATCFSIGCECMTKPDRVSAEYHAYKKQLERCANFPKALEYSRNRISMTAKRKKSSRRTPSANIKACALIQAKGEPK